MSDEKWVWDDETIPDSERLYRRVPRSIYDECKMDEETKQRRTSPAVFQYDYISEDDRYQEGMSIHLESLLKSHGRDGDRAYNWDTHVAAFLQVEHVRGDGTPEQPDAGVIARVDEDAEDEKLGQSHGLIRANTPSASKRHPVWKQIRARLIDHAIFYDPRPEPELAAEAAVDPSTPL